MENNFKISSKFKPEGDQPQAIEKLTEGLKSGSKFQTLLGVTGSGKTFTMANVIENVQKPTLVIAPNKTLAAQLAQEFRTFFPKNAVEYFVSYYDYYQPEAYIASTDTYIEKESQINEEIDRLRHASTAALLSRRDVIICASVSCIYGLGSPEYYRDITLELATVDSGVETQNFASLRAGNFNRNEIVKKLIDMQYGRSDVLARGKFRLTGNTLEIMTPGREIVTRIESKDNKITKIFEYDFLTGEELGKLQKTIIYPAKHFVVPEPVMEEALVKIEKELEERVKYFRDNGKILEAERLWRRTKHDLEMMKEIGYCNGIENYSRFLTDREEGEPPYTLMDYFPGDFLLVIDESHVTVPQLNGMYNGDYSRKKSLIDNGFRLPSAFDNRPLKFPEFEEKVNQVIFTSATPAKYELEKSQIKKNQESIKKPILLVISGPWGSGKTTISKIIEKKFGFVRINNDEIYKKFFPKICNEMWLYPEAINEAEEKMVEIIKDNLKKQKNIVVDYSGGWRLLKYKNKFTADFIVKNLFPAKEIIFNRYKNRGERNEGSLEEIEKAIKKQKEFEYQIGVENFIDTSDENPEETLEKHFAFLKKGKGYQVNSKTSGIVEQIIRPTGLIDPELEIKPTRGQVKNVTEEIKKIIEKKERVLITTLTKKMAEDLSDFLKESKIKAEYLHSGVDTLDRIRILEKLRRGEFDVLVGVNLLREGLDLPEVTLVAILDADKEGFLRSETSLIQTIGRAARNVRGKVILYADTVTGSMKRAIDETNRRRKLQTEYNKKHGITPKTIKKKIQSIVDHEINPQVTREFIGIESLEDISGYIKQREKEMKDAARSLQFERAAIIRDEISELRKVQRK